jgi:hypothetical protein
MRTLLVLALAALLAAFAAAQEEKTPDLHKILALREAERDRSTDKERVMMRPEEFLEL